MKRKFRQKLRRIARGAAVFLMILTLVVSEEILVLAAEVKDQTEDAVDEIVKEQKKEAIKREQQEYIEDNQAVTDNGMKVEKEEEAGSTQNEQDSTPEETESPVLPELAAEEPDELEAQYGEPVEVREDGKIFRTGVDSYKYVTTPEPEVYQDKDGKRKEIDNTLVKETEDQGILKSLFSNEEAPSYYTNTANSMEVKLPSQMTDQKGLTLTNREGKTLELIPAEGEYQKSAVLENAILYHDVYEDVDVQYTVHGNSLKEDIILREPGTRQSFGYTFSGREYEAELENNVITVTGKGEEDTKGEKEVQFYLTAPCMTDARGQVSQAVALSLDKEKDNYHVTVTGDADWLADSERAYPVKIDPTIQIPSSSLSLVTTSSLNGTYKAAAYGYVGYAGEEVTGVYGGDVGKTRMFFKINRAMKNIIPDEAVVQSAFLHTYEYSAYPSSATFACYRLKQNWDPASISWENSVSIGREIAGANATLRAGTGWKSFDIRQSVNDWSTGIAPSYGLMVMATDELEPGAAFYTPYSSSSVQPSFTPDKHPYVEINWIYPNPVDPNYPLDSTTVTLRSLIDCDISGKLQFQGVFADGIATPESTVTYALNDTSKSYQAKVYAGHTKRYPNSSSFESGFSKTTTRYRDKQGNWQTVYPFTAPEFNVLYQIDAAAEKGGTTGRKVSTDQFTVYKVKQYDTLPKIASYYGIPLSQITFDNRVQDMLLVANNTLFIRNPKKNASKPYNPPDLDDEEKAKIDAQLMGRGLHCEFGFEPVNLNTGNFYLSNVDAEIPDYSTEFALERHYNSKGAAYVSTFGRGWQFSYGEYLSKKEDGTLIYTRGDGSSLNFEETGSGVYECPEGYDLELKRMKIKDKEYDFGNGKVKYPVYEYEIMDTDQTVRRFDCFGTMKSITDANSNVTTLSYDKNYNLKAITSPAGQTYAFTMTEDGKVSKIKLPGGGELSYTYDADSNLTGYTDASGASIRYEYDSGHHMTAWYDGKDNQIVDNTYDSEGRVIRQVDAKGHEALLSYADDSTAMSSTITTDGNGNQTTYVYDNQYRTRSITYADGTEEAKRYEENRLTGETDALGHETSYTYDADGNIITETRFDGASKSFTYNNRHEMLSETDYDGTLTEYTYDKDGNLQSISKAGSLLAVYTYDNKGRMIKSRDANGQETTFDYDEAFLTSMTDALGNQTMMKYDARGRLTELTDARGYTTKSSYDLEGRIISETDGAGNTTAYTLDANGQAIASTDGNGNISTFAYDELGNLISGMDEEGAGLSYSYDGNGNRTREVDGEGIVIEKQYDCRNRLVSETDGNGGVKSYEYDALGNIIKETDAKGQSIQYTYDYASGERASVTDESGATIQYTYSADGELLKEDYPDGTSQTYTYDELGREVSRTEVNGLTIENTYDAAGNLLEIDKEGVKTSFVYNAANQLAETTYPNGGVEKNAYDKAGNLKKQINPLGYATQYQYDGSGRLTAMIDGKGQVTTYAYDGNSNQTIETDGNGNTKKTTYNAFNQPSAFTDALGNTVTYGYDKNEHITGITDALGNTSSYEFNALGLPVKTTDANGYSYTIAYDANGNYASIEAPDGGVVSYEYNELDQVVKETDSEGLVTEYTYDVNGNVTEQWDSGGGRMSYTYDESGQIRTKKDALDQTTSYEYDKYGNLAAVEEPGGEKTVYTYDGMGNVLTMTDPEGKVTSYGYDLNSQLVQMEEPGGRITEYAYDEAGQLIKETNALGEETSYTYDKAGNLTGVTDGLGNTETYIYDVGGQVIGQTDKNGNLTTMEYDALGRVRRAVTAEGGEEAYEYDAAGNLTAYTDMEGAKTSYVYDTMGRVTEKTMPEGGLYQYTYNTHGAVLTEQAPEGETTSYEYDLYDQAVKRTLPGEARYSYKYDALGRLIYQGEPEGQEKSYTYDAAGNLLSETDQSGRTVRYVYDQMHRLISTENPLGQKTSYRYDEAGNLNSVVTPMGYQTAYQYDALNRIQEQTDPTGKVTSLAYDAAGNLKEMKEYGGRMKEDARLTAYTYDAAGNQISQTNALGEQTICRYDSMNRLAEETNAAEQTTRYGYDLGGQLTSITDAEGGVVSMSYDGDGNMTEAMDGTGRKSVYRYDESDRLVEAVTGAESAEAVQVQYTYDGRGNLTSQTDGNGNKTSFAYNQQNQKTKETNALGQTERYEYDIQLRLSKVTRASGQTIQYEYNELDDLLGTTYSEEEEGKVLYAYDEDGRRVSMKDLTGTSTYTYDENGRITGVQDGSGHVILYEYDDFGNVSGLTYPDGSQVTYQYDKLDRLTEVTDREGKETFYTYDEAGNLTEVKRPNGTSSVMEYDALNQVERVQNLDYRGKVLSEYQYTYDLGGNILMETISQDGVQTRWEYSYNERGELAGAKATGAVTETVTYGYDKAGNKTTVSRSRKNAEGNMEDAVLKNRYNSVNQLTECVDSREGTTKYTYDADGNLVRELRPDEKTMTYTYDTENRLRAVKDSRSLLQSALYDGDGNRVFVANRNIVTDESPAYAENQVKSGSQKESDQKDSSGWKKGGTEKTSAGAEGEGTSQSGEELRHPFWYGFFQNISQGFDVSDHAVSDALHRYWDGITDWFHIHVLGDEPDRFGIVKHPEKQLPVPEESEQLPELDKEREEALYHTVLVPYGVKKSDRDTYELTGYINDVNRQYTETLMEYGKSGDISSTYEYGVQRLSYQSKQGTQYYAYDGRGSVANLTGANGKNVVSYQYEVYGQAETSAKTRNPYGYNGEYTDYLTGNQYLRARYYNPNTGTFLTEDSELGSLLEPVTQNRYTYAGNDPVNIQDPSGHGFWKNLGNKIVSGAKKAAKAVKDFANKIVSKAKKAGSEIKKAFSAMKRYISGGGSSGGKSSSGRSGSTRYSSYGDIYAGGGYSAYGSRSSGKSKTGHQIFRNIVMIGDKLVSKYEKKSCTSADKAKTQKASVGGALTLEGLSSLGWSVVEIGKVSAGFLVGGAIIMIGGIWFAMPMDAGESDENVEKAQKEWKEREAGKDKEESGSTPKEKIKTPTSNPEDFTKLKGDQGWRDKAGNTWKKDKLHKDHWDVSNKKGKKVKEVDYDGNELWPNGPKNKNK